MHPSPITENHLLPGISILGCGWFGKALTRALTHSGYHVKGSARNKSSLDEIAEAGAIPYQMEINSHEITGPLEFFRNEVCVIAIPPSSSGNRAYYPKQMELITAQCSEQGVNHVVMISSTGVYTQAEGVVNEETPADPESSVRAAEQALLSCSSFSTTVIRLAGLIGPGRNLARHMGGRSNLAHAAAPVNLIHLDDGIGICKEIIHNKAFGGLYHAVCPDHPPRESFYTDLCAVTGFEQPHFLPGGRNQKIITSRRIPDELAYTFKVANWKEWLSNKDAMASL